MRSRRPSIDHAEAVARRLAMLSAELDAARETSPLPGGDDSGQSAAQVAQVVAAPPTRVAGQLLPPALATGAPVEPVSSLLVDDPDEPVVIRAPGRHAARRAPGARERVAPVLQSLRSWAPGQVSVVLVGIVLALGVTCAWLVAGQVSTDVEPVAAPAAHRAPGGGDGVTTPGPTTGTAQGTARGTAGASTPSDDAGSPTDVVVDVAGKVKRPGLVVLPAGSRVADALARAGGAKRGADTTSLNLARVLVDGEQLLVGVEVPAGSAPTPAAGGSTPAGALVSINQADQTQLEGLPGIGPVTASAIIDWRTTHGGFTALDDLLEVRGIGEATMARLRPLITL